MANGVQLATAYISLNVNTSDVGKQIKSAFQKMQGEGQVAGRAVGNNLANSLKGSFSSRIAGASLFAPLQTSGVRWAAKAGTTIAMTLKNAITGVMKTAGVGLGIGAGLGAADIIGSGLDRLKVLQAAQVQLRVMKKSAQEIRQITDDVLSVVQGTPISLDDAMQAVPQALGAGVKQGQELTQYIRDLGDAAASTGGKAGFGQISMIFSQILGKGRLMSEEVLQLEENGVRIRNALMNTLGITGEELNKRLRDGKIGMKEVQQAVQATFGGLSKEMGNTFKGAMGNLRAASARLGANILGVIFGDPENPDDPLSGATEGVGKLTDKLNEAGEWVKDNREGIRGFFRGVGDAARGVGSAVSSVIDWFKKMWQWGSNAAGKIRSAFDSVSSALGKVKTKLTDVVDSVKSKFDEIFGENGWFARQFKKLGDFVDKVRDVLGLGPATAQASPGAAEFNPGPRAPGAPQGKASVVVPGSGVGQFGGGISGTPGPAMSGSLPVGGGPNRGPQASSGPKLNVQMPTQSAIGTPIYSGGVTQDTGGSVEPRNALVQDLIKQQFGDSGAWIGNDYRKPDGYNEHSSGQAADIMISELGQRTEEGIALGDKINKWLIDNAEKIGLQYTIWNGMLYRPDGSTSANPGQGITGNHEDHVHYRVKPGAIDELPKFNRGGDVRGAGTGTSDSIPAMLSNGEHVLTAKDVQAMGGQNEVYAFRAALQQGLIPGFENGGPVDPNTLLENQNQLKDLQKRAEVARQQQRELPADATDMDKLQAQVGLDRANRAATQFEQDMPFTASGQTPPDRSIQNTILDSTEDLKLANQALADARQRDDIPYSQMLELNYAVVQAQRQRDQAIAQLNQQNAPGNFLDEFTRSAGFVPTAAGNTGVAGTSSLAGILNLGNEAVGGLIDTGASLIQSAVSAAATAGTAGAGAAAGPAAGAAASYGIQLAAGVAKRLSSFGFQALSIGADSLIAQLFPFGAPRWLGYDYTGFMPQLGFQEAALTSIEKMGQDAINRQFGQGNNFQVPPQPGSPEAPLADPEMPPMMRMSTEVPGAAPAVGQFGGMGQDTPGIDTRTTVTPAPWELPQVGGGGGSWAGGGEVKIYDQGGILKPGELALNASRRPEKVLTDKQWDALAKIQPTNQGPLVKIDAIYGMSPEDVATQIESKQRLAMMRFAGRP